MKQLLLIFIIISTISAQKDSVNILLKWNNQFQFAGYYIAKELGYYDSLNIAATIVENPRGEKDVEQIVSETHNYVGISTPSVIKDFHQYKNLRIISPIFQYSPLVIVTKKEVTKGNLENIIGHKIDISSTPPVEILLILKKLGINDENTHLYTQRRDIERFINGDIDGIVAYKTDIDLMLSKGGASLSDFDFYFPLDFNIDSYGDCLITSKEFAKNRDLLDRFKKATYKGWKYALQNPYVTIDLFTKKYPTNYSKNELVYEASVVRQLMLPRLIPIGNSNPEKWKSIISSYKELGFIDKDISYKSSLFELLQKQNSVPQWLINVIFLLLWFVLLLVLFNRQLKKKVVKKNEELELQQVLLKNAFENSNQLMVIIDSYGVIQLMNSNIAKMFNISVKDAIGSALCDSKISIDDNINDVIEQVTTKKEPIFIKKSFEIHKKNRHFEFTFIPVIDKKDEIASIIIIGYDITHIKELEEQEKHLQKMQAIGTLAGGIAHDFNNILSGMGGFLDLAILQENGNEQLKEAHLEIQRAMNRAKDLVSQILAYSRKDTSHKSKFVIAHIIEESMKLIRSSIPSTIAVDVKLNSDAFIEGDSSQIHQIMMNLATNSYHAMEEQGSGLLSVELNDAIIDRKFKKKYPNLKGDSYIEIKLSDTGYGISKEDIPRIFEPYYTTKIQGKGTGLGLSLVYTIVHNHNGEITVSSHKGVGTTFSIILPSIEGEEVDNSVKEGKKISKNMKISVLFVDDEEMIVTSSTKFMEHLGFSVTSFTDSIEAYEHFKEHCDKYDIVVSDMTMPNLDGIELLSGIKKINPDVKVLLCSGFNQREEEIIKEYPEINNFLQKPISMNHLVDEIKRICY